MKKEYEPFVDELIELAIRSDIGDGDHTTQRCIPRDERGPHAAAVQAGGRAGGRGDRSGGCSAASTPRCASEQLLEDGARVRPGEVAFYVEGRLHTLLQAERIVLNIMQRMSGVATQTAVSPTGWRTSAPGCSTRARPRPACACWTRWP